VVAGCVEEGPPHCSGTPSTQRVEGGGGVLEYPSLEGPEQGNKHRAGMPQTKPAAHGEQPGAPCASSVGHMLANEVEQLFHISRINGNAVVLSNPGHCQGKQVRRISLLAVLPGSSPEEGEGALDAGESRGRRSGRERSRLKSLDMRRSGGINLPQERLHWSRKKMWAPEGRKFQNRNFGQLK